MNAPIETPTTTEPMWDPFPSPNTIPTGWDLSEMFAMSDRKEKAGMTEK